MSRLNANELAKALGVSRKTITRYVRAGCPSEREGTHRTAPHSFDLATVKAWMKETARTGEQGRPAEGLEVKSTKRGAKRKPKEKSVDELDDEKKDDLVELTRRCNLQIKQLEVQRRTRLEREAAGATLPRDAVFRAWDAQVEIVRSRFRSAPAVIAQLVVGKSYDEAHDILEAEFRSILNSLATEELPV